MKTEILNLYEICEISRKGIERYCLKLTTEDVKKYLKDKRNANGYISGVGGDKSYDCFAVLVD